LQKITNMQKLLLSLYSFFLLVGFGQAQESPDQHHFPTDSTRPASYFDTNSRFAVQRIALLTGVTLEYVEQGDADGLPVIFLHGLSDSWHSFQTVLQHLPPSIHAFAISQRGHGDSERPYDGYSPRHFAADVAAFVRQKNLGKAIVVGHSMGGVNAQQFVLDYPQLARAIVIVDSDPSFRRNTIMLDFQKEVMKMDGEMSVEFMDAFQKGTLAGPIDSVYYKLLVNEGLKTPLPVFKAALSDMVQADFVSQLKAIQCPVLIFWGDKDAICLKPTQNQFTKNIRGARLVVYKGVGHALHWEAPARFAKDLTQFVQSLPSQKAVAKTKR
jgi:non-heme chloroperoxidase